ncbi:MAG: hypothetical protein JSW11_01210, partial [Candidatus Heimdallarchaeota archaeon]
NGGSLLLISDWEQYGTQMDLLASLFGYDFANNKLNDSDDSVMTGYDFRISYDDTNLLSHPITDGVSRVEMYAGDGLIAAPINDIPIIITDSDGTAKWDDGTIANAVSVMSVIEGGSIGTGKICILGDSNLWDSAYDADNDGDLDYYDSDNEILAWNTIDWLCTVIDDSYPVFSATPSDITYIEGTVGHTLSWTVIDSDPDNYTIYKNGGNIEIGSWISGNPIQISIDGLTVGFYNFTLIVEDSDGNSINDTVMVTVDITMAPTLTSPEDISYIEGSTGYNISWVAIDSDPDNYFIYKDGLRFEKGSWISGNPIQISIDGLSSGSYSYTLIVEDTYENLVFDTVVVTVIDIAMVPSLTSSNDITYEEGATGNMIYWTVIGSNPDSYIIYQNGKEIETGEWISKLTVVFGVDGLSIGVYDFKLSVCNSVGYTVNDTVLVTVVPDTSAPEVISPSDITYEEGEIGCKISWTVSDTNPDTYSVYRNETEIETGVWIDDTAIIVNIEGLSTGVYFYNLTVRDSYNNSAIDTVIVNVVDTAAPSFTNSTDNFYEKGEIGNRDESLSEGEGTGTWLIPALLVSSTGAFAGIFIFKWFKNKNNHHKTTPTIEGLFRSTDSTVQFLEETGINKQLQNLEQRVAKLRGNLEY